MGSFLYFCLSVFFLCFLLLDVLNLCLHKNNHKSDFSCPSALVILVAHFSLIMCGLLGKSSVYNGAVLDVLSLNMFGL